MVLSLIGGRRAGPDPWAAPTLEWATTSPPPWYNFAHVPVAKSRTPLWDDEEKLPVVQGLKVDERELLLTSVIAGEVESREPSAEPSPWPAIAAAATTVTFIGSVFSPWAIVFGTVPVAIALIAWFWPKSPEPREEAVIQ
jgi:cytochrome c oxidase subunit 1